MFFVIPPRNTLGGDPLAGDLHEIALAAGAEMAPEAAGDSADQVLAGARGAGDVPQVADRVDPPGERGRPASRGHGHVQPGAASGPRDGHAAHLVGPDDRVVIALACAAGGRLPGLDPGIRVGAARLDQLGVTMLHVDGQGRVDDVVDLRNAFLAEPLTVLGRETADRERAVVLEVDGDHGVTIVEQGQGDDGSARLVSENGGDGLLLHGALQKPRGAVASSKHSSSDCTNVQTIFA